MFLNFSEQLTLKEAYSQLNGDLPQEIPFGGWLFENPDSFLPFPGKISLRNHDYLHLILDLDLSCKSEAFVVGFTMGNDLKVNQFFVSLFKLVARFLYPQKYRFTSSELRYFEKGFLRREELPLKGLNLFIFEDWQEDKLEEIRDFLEIDLNKIKQDFYEDSVNDPSK